MGDTSRRALDPKRERSVRLGRTLASVGFLRVFYSAFTLRLLKTIVI